MTSDAFRSRFRLPPHVAQELIDNLQVHDEDFHSAIPFPIRVLAALHFYATGSFQIDVGDNNHINLSQPSVSRSIAKVSDLIVRHMGQYVKFPTTPQEIADKKEGFFSLGLPDVIGIVDGTHISIIAPPTTDIFHHPRHFRNRKRGYSINVEGVCDSSLKFLSVNATFPGACHDASVWASSSVRTYMQEHWRANQPMYLLGDHGYPSEKWLLTPYHNPVEDHQLIFNTLQVKARKMIEMAYGILKNTFRGINSSRKMHYHPLDAVKIINSCFILYNFMRYNDIPMIEEAEEDSNEENVEEAVNAAGEPTAQLVRDNYARNLI